MLLNFVKFDFFLIVDGEIKEGNILMMLIVNGFNIGGG